MRSPARSTWRGTLTGRLDGAARDTPARGADRVGVRRRPGLACTAPTTFSVTWRPFSPLSWPPRSLCLYSPSRAQPKDDLLLRGGHVIDARNSISAVRDVAIAEGKVAAVAAQLESCRRAQDDRRVRSICDARTHRHPHARLHRDRRAPIVRRRQQRLSRRLHIPRWRHDRGRRRAPGWRNFDDFKTARHRSLEDTRARHAQHRRQRHARGEFEQNLADMEAAPAAEKARQSSRASSSASRPHTTRARNGRQSSAPSRRARIANVPVMVDFGDESTPSGRLRELVTKKLRPGDIYTHMYSGRSRRAGRFRSRKPGTLRGRKRGVIFDVGHGGGSFVWRIAVPAMKEGFLPDSISTDPSHRAA